VATSAQWFVLSLLSASRGQAMTANAFVRAGEVLGVSGNAMRVALSRLSANGEIVAQSRGEYVLPERRRQAVAHVRRYRQGFMSRVKWAGSFVGVLTADLSRRNATQVSRRERALELAGFRHFAHGLWLRPGNLEGGKAALASHVKELGFEEKADVIEVALDEAQRKQFARGYDIAGDEKRAKALLTRVKHFMREFSKLPPHEVAKESFFLGDEVLRFLARDPLLPDQLADTRPREELAAAMEALDERAFAVWHDLLKEA
jgi:phenylacetic acid degradation operon negative regulatory protein